LLLSPEIIRSLLILCLAGMALLALFFLRRRQMSLFAYIGWGLFTLLLPGIGPFLVLLARPGQNH